MKTKFDLQMFAAGDNNSLSARSYQMEFKELLQAVYDSRSYFGDFFVGGIEALDGVKSNAKAFSLKTSDIAVVTGTYDKSGTKGFKTGTANSSRFGARTEIIYTDVDVPYDWNWSFHEGIDRFTVNNDLDVAIADRLELQAKAKTNLFNAKHGAFISKSAGKTITTSATALTEGDVKTVFNELSKHFTDIQAVGQKICKVSPDFYNMIVDSALTVTGKNSSVNIDENGLVRFKGFSIEEVPSALFQTGEVAYAYIAGVAKAFTGISTARTIESEDFDGVALQGAGMAGEYILPDNKAAVVKVKLKTA